jgi:tetratricopeptide (TPR) repeat protein
VGAAGGRRPAQVPRRLPGPPRKYGGRTPPGKQAVSRGGRDRVGDRPPSGPARGHTEPKLTDAGPTAKKTRPAERKSTGGAGSVAGRLPGPWTAEIQATARSGTADEAISLVTQALSAFLEEDFGEAARLAEAARSIAPRSGRAAELLGLALYHAGRWKEALRELLAFRRMTGSLEQNHVIADCYRALGRSDRALEVLSEVPPDSTPPDVWAETMIVAAGALADKGDIERALAALSRTDLNPQSVEPYHLRLWYVQSDLLERAGRLSEAVEGWRSIVAEDPEFFDAAERLSAGPKGAP